MCEERCNDLALTGYKQVFGANLPIERKRTETRGEPESYEHS
jgi:hypothetical protein